MYSSQADAIRTIVVEPAVTRAFWAQPRAWYGDTVRIHIETRFIPDGTKVTLELWEDDSAEGNADDFVAAIEGEYTVQNGRCTVEHKLVWDEEGFGDPSEDEGGAYEFYVRIVVDDYALEARTNLLYVAIEEFRLSG